MGRETNKLNDTQIKSYKLKDGVQEEDLRDGGNLVLRVKRNSSGVTKSWRFPFTLNKVKDFIYIGEYPAVSLADARGKAEQYRKELKRGDNPRLLREAVAAVVHAKALAEEHGAAPVTLGELFDRWHKDYLAHHHSDGGTYLQGTFERHVLRDGMADLRLEHMRQAHVKTILQRVQAKGLTGTVERVLHSLRQMVVWAASFEWMDRDPTLGIKAKTFGGHTNEGDRALADEEVTQLHWRMAKSYLTNRWKHASWLILSTGARVEETMLSEPSHVNLVKGTWTVPVANQKKTNTKKARKDHVIHLSRFAKKHMQALLEMPGVGKHIFPAVARGREIDGPANAKTLTHALGNLQGAEHKGRRGSTELLLEGGPFGSHDLRRTAATIMEELGIHSDVVDRCINHVQPDKMKRTYMRGELRQLMAEAWAALGARLEELTALPDPEPHFEAPRPKYNTLDKTDPVAVAKRASEDAAAALRRAQRTSRLATAKAKRGAPSPAGTQLPSAIDYGDSDLI